MPGTDKASRRRHRLFTRRPHKSTLGRAGSPAFRPGGHAVDRRSFLKLTAAGAAVGSAPLAGPAFSAAIGAEEGVFQYGVAAGDPRADAVVIWTRVTPDPLATPG